MFGIPPRIDSSARPTDVPRVAEVLNGAVISLILLVLLSALYALWDGRQTAIREYEDRQTRLGILLAEDTARALHPRARCTGRT
jgi:hypothetical protein